MLAKFMGTLIDVFAKDAKKNFFSTEQFPWAKEIESRWTSIQAELIDILKDRDVLPNFQDISHNQTRLTQDDQWKTVFLWAYGRSVDINRKLCPVTDDLVQRIPGMKTAMFSILSPMKHIPPHKGPYKGVLRYHLGLIIPAQAAECKIRVGAETRCWSEGGSMIFDDSHEHEVWNNTGDTRVVLFVDFLRPLPKPLSFINEFAVFVISRTDYITSGISRAKKAAKLLEQRKRRQSIH